MPAKVAQSTRRFIFPYSLLAALPSGTAAVSALLYLSDPPGPIRFSPGGPAGMLVTGAGAVGVDGPGRRDVRQLAIGSRFEWLPAARPVSIWFPEWP